MSAPETMGFVRDSLATDLTPQTLPPLSALPLGAQQAQQVAPTGAPGDAPPLDLQGMLSVEPGLIDLILAAGAANRAQDEAQDDPAIYATCEMVQAWLGTHRLVANRKAEKVLWKTLMETIFPKAPLPPYSSFSNFSMEQWTVDNWRFWFIEMCNRTARYEKARIEHARLAAATRDAEKDLNASTSLSRARRSVNELTASEETALITMNEEKRFLTEWNPFGGDLNVV